MRACRRFVARCSRAPLLLPRPRRLRSAFSSGSRRPRRTFVLTPASSTIAAASRARAFNPLPGLLALLCVVAALVRCGFASRRGPRSDAPDTARDTHDAATTPPGTRQAGTASHTRAITLLPGFLASLFCCSLVSRRGCGRFLVRPSGPQRLPPLLLLLLCLSALPCAGAVGESASPVSSCALPLVVAAVAAAVAAEALVLQPPAPTSPRPAEEILRDPESIARSSSPDGRPPPTPASPPPPGPEPDTDPPAPTPHNDTPPPPPRHAANAPPPTPEPDTAALAAPPAHSRPPDTTPPAADDELQQHHDTIFAQLAAAGPDTKISWTEKRSSSKARPTKYTGKIRSVDGPARQVTVETVKHQWSIPAEDFVYVILVLGVAPPRAAPPEATATHTAAAPDFFDEVAAAFAAPPPQQETAPRARAPLGRNAPSGASLDFELAEFQREIGHCRKNHHSDATRIKQQEIDKWKAILVDERVAHKRLSDVLARGAAAKAEAARRAQPAPARAAPPNLDEVRLNLWTVLPDNLAKALGNKVAETLANHGGSNAIINDAALLHNAAVDFFAIPKTCLRKEKGQSGAQQRKATLAALGADPPGPEDDAPPEPSADKTADESSCARALRFFSLGFLGRAARAIDAEDPPQLDDDTAYEKLCALHPAAVLDMPRLRGETFRTVVDPDSLKDLVFKMANGAAAGPDGWTEDLLAPLLADPAVLRFVSAITQSLVDGVSPCSRKRLVASRLVGIPKPDGSMRPIAVGTIWLKIAARYVFSVHRDAVLKHFSGVQFGCGEENGAEIVIHNARRAHESGETVCTIDARNAFNTPCRAALWSAVSVLPCLVPFLGIFSLEYEAPSDLIWHGRSSTRVLASARGTRQGSVFGGLFFSALIHPALLQCRRLFPGVRLFAYLDDVTLTSADLEQLAAAFLFLKAEFAKLRLEFNGKKCEVLLAAGASLPQALVGEVLVKEDGVIKVLGAFLGDPRACSEKLCAKQKRHDHFFRRVVLLAGPAAFAVLSVCGVPRASFFVRTHSPDVSASFVASFENSLCAATVALTNARLDDETRLLAHLPRRDGGLGLTDFRLIAPLAFKASLGQCLPESFPAPVDSQKVATLLLNKSLLGNLGPLKTATRRETTVKGTAVWLVENALWISSHFAAAVRYRLGAAAADDPAHLECAPCAATFSAEDHPTHVTGCVRRSGKNATMKHNRLVEISYSRLRSVGVVCEKEPRDYKAFLCSTCGGKFSKEASIAHARACRDSRFRPTGPDLRVEWGASGENPADQENIVYDWTVVHATAPSHRASAYKALFAEKAAAKEELYGEMVRANGEKFVVLGITSHGVFSKETAAFISRVAGATGRPQKEIRSSLLVALQQHNGATIAQSRGRRWDK